MSNGIFVYPHDCTDFTTTGLVGDLKPLEATYTEEKNGLSEVVIRLPYDKEGRWKEAARAGNIIKCEVPTRIPPVIADNEYATATDVYSTE